MAFEDRDWNRTQAPQRGNAWRLKRYSVNAWIIALCVGVFVIDGFLGKTFSSTMIIEKTTLQGAPLPTVDLAARPTGKAISLQLAAQQWGVEVIKAAQASQTASRETLVQPLALNGNVVGLAFSLPSSPLKNLLHFSTSTAFMGDSGSGRGFPQLWRFIGFQFLHANLTHLIFNMMGLWFFGPVVERYLGGKRYGAFYLLCGMCGAAMYLLLNFLGSQLLMMRPDWHLPFLLPNNPTTPLIGASAGVFGVIMAAAYLMPRATVLVFFVIPMQLRNLAYALVGVALLTIFFGGDNAGGEAAHLGGAIAGFTLIRKPHLLHTLFDWMGRVDPTSQSRRLRRGRIKGVVAVADIDRILDKIQREGLNSRTEQERATLRQASQR